MSLTPAIKPLITKLEFSSIKQIDTSLFLPTPRVLAQWEIKIPISNPTIKQTIIFLNTIASADGLVTVAGIWSLGMQTSEDGITWTNDSNLATCFGSTTSFRGDTDEVRSFNPTSTLDDATETTTFIRIFLESSFGNPASFKNMKYSAFLILPVGSIVTKVI